MAFVHTDPVQIIIIIIKTIIHGWDRKCSNTIHNYILSLLYIVQGERVLKIICYYKFNSK